MRRITVHIDSLVLKGFRYEDRHAISAALQEELTRVLATPGAVQQLARMGSPARIRIGNISVGANAQPHEIGTEIGRAVGSGLIP